jgi:hypothetical protein
MSRVWRAASPAHSDDPSIRPTPSVLSSVPSAYQPLYKYLRDRYASNVVLSFDQIEALTGTTLPAVARSDRAWWTDGATRANRHAEAWITAQRSAAPNLAARNVSFERVS